MSHYQPRIYHFGPSGTDGRASDKALLGGKGANLAEMAHLGLPVPPGFTITTDVCAEFQNKGRLPGGLMEEVCAHVERLEAETGKRFGEGEHPLLLSVRSGAAASMPGMMDTVLNLGLNDASVAALGRATDGGRFAFDCYRRLIHMFGDVVMGVPSEEFEQALSQIKLRYRVTLDNELPARGLRQLYKAYKHVYRRHTNTKFPQDPYEQLRLAIEAVFRSWNGARAQSYRRIHRIEGLRGTAVNVQAMVFGNVGDDSGTGVAFTRNPATGANELYGEYLVNAQGEDVVAGVRTPQPLTALRAQNPALYDELLVIRRKLERHFRDMQDIELTVERGKLYILQTRTGKRTGAAAVEIAVGLVGEGLIDQSTALVRVPPEAITQVLLPSFSAADKATAVQLATGLPASPGAATGKLAFSAAEAVQRAKAGDDVILVRRDTSPEDIDGMHLAKGIITSTGGMTSHAAVVARGWGKCCVVGAGALDIDVERRSLTVAGRTLGGDDVISVDGATGEIMFGALPRHEPSRTTGAFATLLQWADEHAQMRVRANADTPEDARRARDLGATGIGLCRTEHMFFESGRISAMREMILAENAEAREKALAKLLPFQRRDFVGILKAMAGLPVTIRLLDPPLHEFVPHTGPAQEELAREIGVPAREIERRVKALQEANPMLGHRGCRLLITHPEIARMQVTAIVQAALQCEADGIEVHPEIMIPLVGTERELEVLRAVCETTIREILDAQVRRVRIDIPIGTMIEVPRAALRAGPIAGVADFFSFGTNDLTQLTFGYSRDDVNTFMPDYLAAGILAEDPFQSLDQSGVGELVAIATERGRAVKADLKVGVCGEHGGHPASVRFFHAQGLDYVSCSPFRVPVARLVAGQAGALEPRQQRTRRRAA